MLANLLQNAVKYSPPGTPIGVSARQNDDGELELRVDDEGPGVPARDRDRIFEPFFRRKQKAGQPTAPGHGLGLAICQSIVLTHGGRMQVTDRPGGGARFSVCLPTRPPGGQRGTKGQLEDRLSDPAEHARGRRRGATGGCMVLTLPSPVIHAA